MIGTKVDLKALSLRGNICPIETLRPLNFGEDQQDQPKKIYGEKPTMDLMQCHDSPTTIAPPMNSLCQARDLEVSKQPETNIQSVEKQDETIRSKRTQCEEGNKEKDEDKVKRKCFDSQQNTSPVNEHLTKKKEESTKIIKKRHRTPAFGEFGQFGKNAIKPVSKKILDDIRLDEVPPSIKEHLKEILSHYKNEVTIGCLKSIPEHKVFKNTNEGVILHGYLIGVFENLLASYEKKDDHPHIQISIGKNKYVNAYTNQLNILKSKKLTLCTK